MLRSSCVFFTEYVIFTGITVAVAVYAAGEALVMHGNSEAVDLLKDTLQ